MGVDGASLWGYTPEVWSWLAVGFGGLALRGAAWAGGGGFPAMREGLEVDRLAHVVQESGGAVKAASQKGRQKSDAHKDFHQRGCRGIGEDGKRHTHAPCRQKNSLPELRGPRHRADGACPPLRPEADSGDPRPATARPRSAAAPRRGSCARGPRGCPPGPGLSREPPPPAARGAEGRPRLPTHRARRRALLQANF